MTDTNTGDRNAKGRIIWKGPRGGLFVRGATGKRLPPANGRKPRSTAGRRARSTPIVRSPVRSPARSPAKSPRRSPPKSSGIEFRNLPPNVHRLIAGRVTSPRNRASLALTGKNAAHAVRNVHRQRLANGVSAVKKAQTAAKSLFVSKLVSFLRANIGLMWKWSYWYPKYTTIMGHRFSFKLMFEDDGETSFGLVAEDTLSALYGVVVARGGFLRLEEEDYTRNKVFNAQDMKSRLREALRMYNANPAREPRRLSYEERRLLR